MYLYIDAPYQPLIEELIEKYEIFTKIEILNLKSVNKNNREIQYSCYGIDSEKKVLIRDDLDVDQINNALTYISNSNKDGGNITPIFDNISLLHKENPMRAKMVRLGLIHL